MMFPNLHHNDFLYGVKHWLRDGGFRIAFDKMFMHACCGIFAALLSGSLSYFFLHAMAKQKPTMPKIVSRIIDHTRDGTAGPRIDTHLRFNLVQGPKK